MSLVTTEIREKSEIYHGNKVCQEKIQEFLKKIGLPNGLLPLKDVEEVGFNRESGFFWLKQKEKTTHKFENLGKVSSYDIEVTAEAEYGKIMNIKGVKSREFMLWIAIADIYIDNPPTGKIYFKTYSGISKSLPFSTFEIAEESTSHNQNNQIKEL
ncbi:uncharacterized protein [Cicer arietinum]|uniref:Uncharacterized protein LOC101506943 n=1 Tax=Cicer arietinum TaxID=3827 RepID=A0A1S2XU24_CICAR|nr:uncharacterized protein LOC101506943 [Cicer arietinum]